METELPASSKHFLRRSAPAHAGARINLINRCAFRKFWLPSPIARATDCSSLPRCCLRSSSALATQSYFSGVARENRSAHAPLSVTRSLQSQIASGWGPTLQVILAGLCHEDTHFPLQVFPLGEARHVCAFLQQRRRRISRDASIHQGGVSSAATRPFTSFNSESAGATTCDG